MVDVVGIVLASIAALGLAGQAVFVRLGTNRGKSSHALIVVFLVNLLILGPITLVSVYPDYGLNPRGIAAFIGAGVVGTMLGRAFLFAGVERVGASRAEPIKASMPLWATISAVILLGETLTPTHLAGIVLIVVGVGLISWEGSRIRSTTEDVDPDLPGFALPFAAALFFGFEPIFAKIGFAAGTPYLVGLTLKVIAALAVFTVYLVARDRLPRPADIRSSDLRWYVAAGVASSVFLLAYYAALARAPVVIVVPIMQSSPLLVVLISLVFLQHLERVTWRLASAASVVVAGAVLVSVFS